MLQTRDALRAALAHRARRQWSQAEAALQTAAEAARGDAAACAAVADVCSRFGKFELAYELYDRAIVLRPADSRYWFNRAAVRRFLGQLDAAEADYDRCLALAPDDSQAYLNRSQLRTQSEQRNHVAALLQQLSRHTLSWQDEVALRFALAKEYEDLGRHEQSWQQLAQGASLRRRHLQYSLGPDLATVDWLIEAFPVDRPPASGADCAEPIFIIGMPRTGSTLVERILGSHSQVFAAGELSDLALAVVAAARGHLNGPETRQALIAASAGVDLARLGADYLARTRASTGHTPRFTDKMPLNYLYCGLIDAALPNASIVHVTRHPMATCYGIYKVLFEQGYPFSYDLAEIGAYYIGYRRLMAHWHRRMPGRILDVAYEDLVADPESQIRRLLDALGLSWEAGCLDFHRNPAATSTASASQVRQPIHTRALTQWRHYTARLAPLRRQLEAAGIDCA